MLNEYRIFGPPGTGKTTKLSQLITSACQEYGSDSVCAASFTKTAAAELLGRDLPLNEDCVGTLHALCYRLLDNPSLAVDRTSIDQWNEYAPRYERSGGTVDLDDPWTEPSGSTDGDKLYDALKMMRNLCIDREAWPPHVEAFATKWEQFKADTGKMDFLDLIDTCLNEHLAPDVRVGFFDEVQDFAPVELALVRQWGTQFDRYYLAGDDDQAIFSFKGATPDAFLYPAIPQAQKIFLEQSYRLPAAIHRHVMDLVGAITPRELKTYRPRAATGEVDTLYGSPAFPDYWLHPVEEALKQGSVMLLTACNYQTDEIVKALRGEGLAFSNRWRRSNRKWNPLHAARTHITALDRLEAFLRPQRAALGARAREWTYLDLWHACEGLDATHFPRGSKALIKAAAEGTPGSPVLEADLLSWLDNPATLDAFLSGDLAWYRRACLPTARKSLYYALDIVAKYHHVPTPENRTRLTVGTIHSVKGGQADTVFLFPGLSQAAWEAYYDPGNEAGEMATRRQMYVGMTRAKERLVLMTGGQLVIDASVGL